MPESPQRLPVREVLAVVLMVIGFVGLIPWVGWVFGVEWAVGLALVEVAAAGIALGRV